MKTLLRIIYETLLVIFLSPIIPENTVNAQTNIPEGNVSGIWTVGNSPYQINGDVIIPDGDTLTIEPGVKVVFMGHYKFNVQGRLLATGTKEDTITFTAQDTITGWHGIRFVSTHNTNDTSRIIYCKLQYGKANTGSDYDKCGGALFVSNFSKLLISDCLINFNMNEGNPDYTGGGAICFWHASPVLTKNTISYNNGNTGGAIICWSNANPVISNNIIAYNNALDGGGIYIGSSSNPLLINNIIINNHATDNCGGIRCYSNSKPLIINNVITNNHAAFGGGIDLRDNADPIFINTIIYENSASTGNQVFIDGADSDPSFLYCDIGGGKDEFKGTGAGNNYNGTYSNNIDSDPLFADPAHDDFHLMDPSPCISTGIDSIEINSKWYYAPQYDQEGNSRPNPSGTAPDMGAIESISGHAIIPSAINDVSLISTIELCQNYPNPFGSGTIIDFSIPVKSIVNLKVIDYLGRTIAILADDEMKPGEYRVSFNAAGLPDGIYYYQLSAGNSSQTRKCLVVK